MKDRPFWWPDGKGFAAIAYFVLAFCFLAIVREDKSYLDNAAFMGLAGSVLGAGGIGLILAFYYGSSSGAKDANARTDKVLDAFSEKQP